MKSLADALVYAVAYISVWDDRDEEYLDEDVGALESIATFLEDSTDAERDTLAEAAERALAAEKASSRPREDLLRGYSTWMEDMFGEEWTGNKRV